jgi:hypothetical protein
MGWFSRKKKSQDPNQNSARTARARGMESLEERTVLSGLTISDELARALKLGSQSGGKIDSSLAQLYDAYSHRTTDQNFSIGQTSVANGRVYLDDGRVSISVRSKGSVGELNGQLAGIGIQGARINGDAVTGWLGVDKIDDLMGLSSVRSAEWNIAPVTNVGLVTSQADIGLRANIARATYGVDGRGVRIGVISDSYNSLGGAAAGVLSGDLPSNVVVLSDQLGTDEGRGMIELIHDLAPGAEVYFHAVGNTPEDMASAMERLAAAGCSIIVDDVSFFNEPLFQDGIIAQTIDRLTNQGVAMFGSAGNAAANSFEDNFRKSGQFIEDFFPPGTTDDALRAAIGTGELMDFNPGNAVDIIQPVVSGGSVLFLQWDNSFASATGGRVGAIHDYDVLVVNADGELITLSFDRNVVTGDAFEAVVIPEDAAGILIVNRTGANNFLKYTWRGPFNAFEFTNSQIGHSTVSGNHQAAGLIAVGAAFYNNPVNNPEDFTSLGTVKIFFDTEGNRVTTTYRNKPQVTGIDGTNTTFFGGIDVEGDGFPNFFGTSAAAPHVAAVAALMKQVAPSATPRQIRIALEQTAADMGPVGYDFFTGYGLVQADAAIAFLQRNLRSVIIVDVSQSMTSFDSLDINGDGNLSQADDLDNDGVKGTPLDQAIAVLNRLDTERFFMPKVSVIVFGRDARFIDVSPEAGVQTETNYVPGYIQQLTSIAMGQGGSLQTTLVDSSKSYYDRALWLMYNTIQPNEFVDAYLITDGSGLLGSSNLVINALASKDVTVNTFVVGHYYTAGSLGAVQRIADGTQGSVALDFTPKIVDNKAIRPVASTNPFPSNNIALNQFESIFTNGFQPMRLNGVDAANAFRPTPSTNGGGTGYSSFFNFSSSRRSQNSTSTDDTDVAVGTPVNPDPSRDDNGGSDVGEPRPGDVAIELDDPVLIDRTDSDLTEASNV